MARPLRPERGGAQRARDEREDLGLAVLAYGPNTIELVTLARSEQREQPAAAANR